MDLNFKEFAYNELLWSKIPMSVFPGATAGGAVAGLPGAVVGGLASWGYDKWKNMPPRGTATGQPDPRHFHYYRDATGKVQREILPQYQKLYGPHVDGRGVDLDALNDDPNEPFFYWKKADGTIGKKLKGGRAFFRKHLGNQ